MRLKSLTMRGFKSFSEPTSLQFGEGVSVVVGPNGSGKSNVTDAVLWAMGEQSPLAVRGQSMQDVIFAGGRAAQARSAAEVEIVLDNSDQAIDLPLSEISILRRLDRTGDGGYWLNGARCRLTDVIELLSDTGLGRETHTVVSQGRVEEIVISKPRDRRLLIEEAAGLGKHRKRRRRAQLKLAHTQENLDRALDIEREARTRLRPLKRQAEAAELHERLERQTLQARWQLVADSLRARRGELADAQQSVAAARAQRADVEARLASIVARRRLAERALTDRSERRDALAGRLYAARSACERVGLRGEQALTCRQLLERRVQQLRDQLAGLEKAAGADGGARPRAARAAGKGDERSSATAAGGARRKRSWQSTWRELRKLVADGVARACAHSDAQARAGTLDELVAQAERLVREAVAQAVAQGGVDGPGGEREADRSGTGEDQRARGIERLQAQLAADRSLVAVAERLEAALQRLGDALQQTVVTGFQDELEHDSAAGDEVAGELRECARLEAQLQSELHAAGELVTGAEVAAQRVRDQAAEAEDGLRAIAERLGRDLPAWARADAEPPAGPSRAGAAEAERDRPQDGVDEGEDDDAHPLTAEQVQALQARVARLERRREQLGPVNPLAQEEYAQALAHVTELEERRGDLETALRELNAVIKDADRQIAQAFERTFSAAAEGFERLAGELFPGGSGRLRLVEEGQPHRPVLGGQPLGGDGPEPDGADGEREPNELDEPAQAPEDRLGVEIELTPAGKAAKRLSLLSGGEKSMAALAFLFALFLARPCPFYILDEVEAALDDLNLERFVGLLRRYSDRAQFIVITHQKRTVEAADWLYGVAMRDDGISKVVSRRLPAEPAQQLAEVADVA